MVLIESQAKRARFLRDVASELEIDVAVRHARAEDEGRGDLRDSAGGVVARALAAPPVALELCLPLVRLGGRVLLPASPEAPTAPARGGAGPVRERTCLPGGEPMASSRPEQAQQGADGEGDDTAGRESTPGRAAPPPADDALAAVAEILGGADVRWRELPVPGADGPRWVMMVDKRRPTPERFPRRPGVPKRRPLGGDVASVN
jgi:16S rRNA (guanine527-N7)-methyltransferase